MKNTNYFKEIKKINQKKLILKNKTCEKCGSKLGAIKPDRVWCTNENCDYAELHIVGNGVCNLKFE